MNGDRLDAAVLRLQPLPNGPAELPESITVSASPTSRWAGRIRTR